MTRLHTSLGLLSAAVIAYQLVLMHLLSIVQWHHFAYMVISVALLGFGASGTVMALAPKSLLARSDSLVPLLMLLSGGAMAWVFALSQTPAVRFDSYLLFTDSSQVASLLLTYLLFFVPFFLGALAIGLILIRHVDRIGSYYFANLLGSGLGGIGAIALLRFVEARALPAAVGLLAIAAALLVPPARDRRHFTAIGILSIVAVCLSLVVGPEPVLSQFKGLSRTLNLPAAEIVLERHGPQGLLQVVSTPALRHAPGMSLSEPIDVPSQLGVFVNGEWLGAVTAWSKKGATHLLDHTTSALPYVMQGRDRVLVLNAGTGDAVQHALTNGAHRVVAVESNAAVVALMSGELAAHTDSLYLRPEVSIAVVDPRAYLATGSFEFDVITIPEIGAFGGTVGLSAMQENYLLTVSGLEEMWGRLSADGVLTVTVWLDYPYRHVLKALTSLAAMLERVGVERASEHLIAARSWGAVTIVASRSVVSSAVSSRVRAFCEEMSFDPLLLPDLQPEERSAHNLVDDEAFFELVDRAVSPDRETLYEEYEFAIRPATDDRPYFAQFLRWKNLPRQMSEFGLHAFPFLELGYLIALVTFVQIVIAAFLLILVPLFRLGLSGTGRARTLVYFGAIGTGYLFVEMVLIQRFTLYLGHPIHAAAAVIAAVLIFSGAGSYVSERWSADRQRILRSAGLIALVLLPYAVLLTPLLKATIGMPIGLKALIAFILIAPPTFLMGFPFPLGLRALSSVSEVQLPWAWGINGCLSVVSTALAAILAVELGLVVVGVLAAGFYAVAAAAAPG